MERQNKRLLFFISDILFFTVLMGITSLTQGYVNSALRFAAYLLPIILFVIYIKKFDKEIKIGADIVKIKKEHISLLLLIPPVLLLIAITSLLTNTVASLFFAPGETLKGNIFELIFMHAFVVGISEEIIFRLIPLKLIGDMGKLKYTVISALFFMLIHTPLSMPYAFVGGVIFALIAFKTGSILPSVFIHIVNNTFGVLLMYNGIGEWLSDIYVYVLIALSIICLIIFVLLGKTQKNANKT